MDSTGLRGSVILACVLRGILTSMGRLRDIAED
jgi:hypothetical protein